MCRPSDWCELLHVCVGQHVVEESASHPLPGGNVLRFLDLSIKFSLSMCAGVLWPANTFAFYLGPFKGSEKRGGHFMFEVGNNWVRSCQHSAQQSFGAQISRLEVAGYHPRFLPSIAEVLRWDSRKQKHNKPMHNRKTENVRRWAAVTPYVHHTKSRKLPKEDALKFLCLHPVNWAASMRWQAMTTVERATRKTKQTSWFAIACHIRNPRSCKWSYVGQMWRCIDVLLQEHADSLKANASGHLVSPVC